MDPVVICASIALVGILIFVHEFGHFIVAKTFGVGVKVFSVGFGRRLFGFEHNGTDYRVCLLPIGGYVLMEGADPFADDDQVREELESPTSLLRAPIWQRLLIVSAGPVFNLVLPVVVLTALFMAGQPSPASVIGTVEYDSPAFAVGLEPGDSIVKVNGQPVELWSDLYTQMAESSAQLAMELEVLRGDVLRSVTFAPRGEDVAWMPGALGMYDSWSNSMVGVSDPSSPAGKAGIESFETVFSVDGVETDTYAEVLEALGEGGEHSLEVFSAKGKSRVVTLSSDPAWVPLQAPFQDPLANSWGLYPAMLFVKAVAPDSAAEEGGVLAGDRLVGIDSRGLASWGEVLQRISSKQDDSETAKPASVLLERNGRVVALELVPRLTKTTNMLGHYEVRAVIGIERGGDLASGPMGRRYYSFVPAVGMAWQQTTLIVKFTIGQLGKLVTGRAAPSKTIGGPVEIFRQAGHAARDGVFAWARLMAALSVSLGIINFLPVPVLDGGQFLFFAVEGIRGRPVPLRFRERAQQIGVLMLVALLLTVLVFDINRWIAG